MSGDFQEARRALGAAYARSQVIRPDATRSQSSEVFLVGLGRRPMRSSRSSTSSLGQRRTGLSRTASRPILDA